MRVLLVSGSFPPMACGVGDYTSGLADALAACEGVDVAVLTSREAEDRRRRYALFPVMSAWSDDELALVKDVLGRWRPDVVHVQFPTQGYRGKLPWHLPALLRVRGVPVVQTWHEYVPSSGSALALARATWRDLPIAVFGRDVIVVRPEFERRIPWWFRGLTLGKRFHLIPNAPSVPRVVLDEGARAEEHRRWAEAGKALLVFFGFCYEHKGIDDALAAMDPVRHHLVLAGGFDASDPYQAGLLRRIQAPPFAGNVTMAGFLSADHAARLLATADAVVLPFRSGGGNWNTSLKAAALQGTFVVTTSPERHGLDEAANVYYARPRDPADLAAALGEHLGRRVAAPSPELAGPDWPEIARRHLELYRRNA